ncbi:WD40 repeat domain-containing protein [Stenotrophomonas sp. NPDC087984]
MSPGWPRPTCPGRRTIATGSHDDKVRLWDAKTGRQRATFSDSYQAEVGHLAFSPDGKTLAAPAGQGLSLWNVATRKPRAILLTGGKGPESTVRDVAFSPDGRLIAGNDTKHHKVYLWKNRS